MRKLAKRILSLIVVAVVMITSLPFSVMAETAANTDGKGMTIDLSITDESIDEVLNNIQGLNALANEEKENAHQHGSSEKHTHTVDAQEVITDSESNSFEDGIFDIVVEETVEQEVDVKLESTTTTESPTTDFEYSIKNGEVTINDYIGSATEVVIPEKIEGYPVTSIGNHAFFDCSSLTSVAIPNSVTSIGYGAFSWCSSLESITIPDSVTSIGDYAFDYCSSLESITIPDSVTSIGDYAFYNCSSLTSVAIPDSVTSIEYCAFYGCSSLTSITIPDSVTSIGDYAFYGCSSLTSITIPDSVTSIGDYAFSGCSSLTSITVSADNLAYLIEDGVLFNKAKTEIIFCLRGKVGEYTIPDSVTSIGDSAFYGCSSLTSITIPNGVTSIGDDAFYNCSSLASITIPDSVTSIGDSAFYGCSSLTSITIPNGVTSIGDDAFYNCSSLASITIPDSVTSIGNWAFSYCSSLTSITIPDGVTSIGDYAFYYCSLLTSITIPDSVTSIGYCAFYGCSSLTSITIPDSVTSIGNWVFSYCSSLTSITIPDSVTSIGTGAFSGCSSLTSITVSEDNLTYLSEEGVLFNKAKTEIICCPGGKIGEYTIPDSVTSIGGDAFANCYSLTSITIPDSVTSIGYWAFSYCSSLTSITIPNGVTSIGTNAFFACHSLNHVYYTGTETEWNNVTIDSDNEKITNAVIHYEVVPGSETSTKKQDATCTINQFEVVKCNYCDCILETVEEKDTAIGHNYVEGICANCGLSENFPLSYRFNNGKIVIINCYYSATTVEIPGKIEGYPVTRIGDYGFVFGSSLTSITIPNSVTSICYSAFPNGCSLNHVYYTGTEVEWNNVTIESNNESITNAVIHFNVVPGSETSTKIQEATCTINRFEGIKCNYCDCFLETVEEKDTAIGHNYVEGICANCGLSENFPLSYRLDKGEVIITDCDYYATTVEIPEKIEGYPVTSIGDYAFRGCSSLTSITIPDGVTSIGNYAFSNCSSLTSITIPDSVTSIGYFAFSGCSSLTSITIPESVTSIGDDAFYNCSSLTSITVSADNLAYLSEDGVLFNKAKTEIICCPGGKVGEYTIPDSVTSIEDSAFYNCSSLTSITIPDSVTSIEDSAFDGCSALTSITIPNSVTSIGWRVFSRCSSLTSIIIPESVTSIESLAFVDCSSLTSITIPESVTSLVNGAFEGCSSLTSITVSADNPTYLSEDGVLFNKVKTEIICCPSGKTGEYTIPNSVTSLVNGAFEGCSSLTSITIPDGVTSIGDYAFRGCSSLTSITIPDGVTSIGDDAFSDCSSLTSITIPDGVTSIEHSVFGGCSALTSITIPNSVTSIGQSAFFGCSSLKTVYYTGTEAEWNNIYIHFWNNDYLLIATIRFNYVPGAIPEIITPSTDSDVAIDSDTSMVTGLSSQMTPADVAAKFEGAENIQIVDKDGNVLAADALVGTGSKIQLVENGEVVDEVTVVIQGEIDGNGIIDSDDAIYMLRNTLFPDVFPVVVDDDIDGNGVYDSDDAIYLLRYTLFPDMFPLK